MKKTVCSLLLAFFAAPVFFSCTEKEPAMSIPEPSYQYHFVIDEDAETRAFLNDEGVFWESGDVVGVFAGNSQPLAAAVNVSSTPKTIDFTTASPLTEGTLIYASHPYVAGSASASAATIVFPQLQHGGAVSAMPMAGVPVEFREGVTNGAIHFRNLGSILDFRVYSSQYAGERIQSVTLTATYGGFVSGKASMDLASVSGTEIPALTWTTGNTSVTLKQDAQVAVTKDAAAEGHLYMVVAPGTFSGSVHVVTDQATYSFPFTDLVFNRNGLKRINLNLESPNALRGGVYSIENDKVATYLDLVDNHPYNPPADYSFTHMTAELQSGNTNRTNRLDWPKPVPVTWTTSVSNPTVTIYDEAQQEEPMANVTITSAKSANIYNLIPGRTYTYVVKAGNTFVGEGCFSTTGRRRMIKVGDSPYGQMYANNCRDFGGQMTRDGRRIKYGKMFRGSNMDKVTDVQKDYLRNKMHIGLDVDLRTTGTGAGQGENVLYDALNLGSVWHTTETFNSWSDFSNTFSGRYKLTTILTKVFEAVNTGKGVYIHCKVGADRTGYVCMLLEALLGVEQGWCDVDYELTSFSGAVDKGVGRWRVGAYSSGGKTLSNNWYYRPRNNILQGVDFIYSLSGGSFGDTFQAKAVNYVVNTLGIPYADVQTFQNNMLEDLN